MIKRRDFLTGTGTIATACLLSACSSEQTGLNVQLLQGSIPARVLSDFRSTLSRSREKLTFKTAAQLNDLFELLQSWEEQTRNFEKKSDSPSRLPRWGTESLPRVDVDLLTLGNYWLTEAIERKLIQPLAADELPGWKNLPESCQKLVRRDLKGESDEKGLIWGAPYRWGCTLIAYRRDKFKDLGWIPSDWSDLWREELQNRISLLNQPREVIGLVLKKLGHSYNALDLNKIPDLESQLQALHRQVKFYDSRNYIEPLILEDTWLAVGWSGDLLPLQKRIPEIELVIPRSGTSLWADLWVKPAFKQEVAEKESTQSLLKRWIDFCWQPQSAIKISLLTDAASPIISSLASGDLSPDIRKNPVLLPDAALVKKSEFILPLPERVRQEYESLWREMRARSAR